MQKSALSSRLFKTLFVVTVLVINGAMVQWCWSVYRDMGLLNIAWTRASQASIERAAFLAQIERSIGYGEFIHNFKNYVLRRTDEYAERTEVSLAKLSDALLGMRAQALQAEDREDLRVIEQTVDAYRKKFQRAQGPDWRGMSSAELDRLVYVDDGPAVTAFQNMRDRLLPVFMSETRTHERQIAALWQHIGRGVTLFIPVILINSALGIWGGLHLRRRRKAAREPGEASSSTDS